MDEREALVQAALGELGTAGGEKYVAWYNGAAGSRLSLKAAWCAIFASWCARQAGVSPERLPNFASCTAGRNQFRRMGVWRERTSGYAPRRGDLILFDWDADPALAEHVGIVTGADEEYVYTVEGNSGNMVREKRYTRSSGKVLGYVSWKEEMEMTKEEARTLIDQKAAEVKEEAAEEARNYADRHDAMVMTEAKRYARQVAAGTLYHKAAEIPAWGKETVERLMASGALRGGADGDLALSEEMLRVLVIMERVARA